MASKLTRARWLVGLSADLGGSRKTFTLGLRFVFAAATGEVFLQVGAQNHHRVIKLNGGDPALADLSAPESSREPGNRLKLFISPTNPRLFAQNVQDHSPFPENKKTPPSNHDYRLLGRVFLDSLLSGFSFRVLAAHCVGALIPSFRVPRRLRLKNCRIGYTTAHLNASTDDTRCPAQP